MTELVVLEDIDDWEPPSYRDEGFLIFKLLRNIPSGEKPKSYEYTYLVEEYNYSGCVYWIHDGIGIEYFLNEILEPDLEDGWYIIDSIVGEYIRGDGWITDDDEDWYPSEVRKATEEDMKKYWEEEYSHSIGEDLIKSLEEAVSMANGEQIGRVHQIDLTDEG